MFHVTQLRKLTEQPSSTFLHSCSLGRSLASLCPSTMAFPQTHPPQKTLSPFEFLPLPSLPTLFSQSQYISPVVTRVSQTKWLNQKLNGFVNCSRICFKTYRGFRARDMSTNINEAKRLSCCVTVCPLLSIPATTSLAKLAMNNLFCPAVWQN